MNAQRGFTLIEVLVAVLLMSIGLLGVAAMQINGLRYHQGASTRAHATALLGELADRMRANRAGVQAGNYIFNTTPALPADPNCLNNNCTPAQQSTLDIREWRIKLAPLPNAAANVARNNATGVFTITITWNDLVGGAAVGQTATVNVLL
jgi:type IV pilus assembly protein PilV